MLIRNRPTSAALYVANRFGPMPLKDGMNGPAIALARWLSMGNRVVVSLIVGVFASIGLGVLLDKLNGTRPEKVWVVFCVAYFGMMSFMVFKVASGW